LILYKQRFKAALSIMKFLTPNVGNTFEKMYRGGTPEAINSMPRPMIKYIAALNQKNLVGAEIGVGSGANSLSILNTLDMKHLHCVDPFPSGLGKPTKETPIPVEAKDVAFAALKDKPVVWHVETSLDAAKKIDEQLDFVYIDGLHDFKSVIDDIAAWYPLVRKGGVVGGHDFTIQGEAVIDAVNKFAVDTNLYLNIAYPDWWIIKR
jgi:hypothetical protein